MDVCAREMETTAFLESKAGMTALTCRSRDMLFDGQGSMVLVLDPTLHALASRLVLILAEYTMVSGRALHQTMSATNLLMSPALATSSIAFRARYWSASNACADIHVSLSYGFGL